MLKNKPFWFGIALIAAYLLIAYLAVPPWLQPRLEQYVKKQWGGQLHFENLRFDPLTWSVDLTGVRLVSGEQGLFPDITLTAQSVHVRFNFWRLHAAVSTLVVKAPIITIDGNSTLMPSAPYPFVTQWQGWISSLDKEHRRVPIRRWRLETGRMVLSYPGSQKADEVIMDELSIQAQKSNDVGQREYELAFASAKGSITKMQGHLDEKTLVSSGQYQWTATLPQDEYSDLTVTGEFSISPQGDLLLIELAQSQLNSDQLERCVLDSMLCARIYPLNVNFSATLQAATQGVRLLSAQLQQAAFEMDASLARGTITLHQQLAWDSADLQISALPESEERAGQDILAGDTLEFELALQRTGDGLLNAHMNLTGRFHPQSEHARMRFTSLGEPEFLGELQWQWIPAQHPKEAYPQVELQLQNPGASLAKDFIAEQLSAPVAAGALQLLLTAKLKDEELRFTENVRLQQVNTSPANVVPELSPNVPATVPPATPLTSPRLDAAWLLPLLRNLQSEVELAIPEQNVPLTEQLSLQSMIQAPILAYLNIVAAQPLEGLAQQMGKEGQNLAEVHFESGSAELNATSSESLTVLAEALSQRPGLGVELAGVYDPLIDKKALQTEQIRTHIALATAAELAFQSGSEPPDFSDPRVHSVIDEFARQRLPIKVLSGFSGHFGEADADRGVVPEGDVAAYYAALFELLVDYAEIPQAALTTLARYRAQAVIELLAGQGVSRDRLHAAPEPRSNPAELTGVPLQLQLKIHSESPELLENSSSGELDHEN